MPPVRKTKAKKSTKKPLAENIDHNDSYEDEMSHDPKDDEIAKLQEQIRMLKIENATLRKNVETKNPMETPSTPKARRINEINTPVRARRNSTQSIKAKERGCSCTGSCANKKCGCVKKDAACSEFCKCSDSCQNQLADIDEDKENHDEQRTSEEKNVEKKKVSNKNVKGKKFSTSSSESEPQSPETSNSDKGVGNSSYSSNASTQTDGEGRTLPQPELNPMKPSRQLERSPLQKLKSSPNSTANTTANATVFHDDDVFLPVPKVEAEEDELSPPDEIYQMEVDWEKHQAQLVQCRKCKRKFHPYRVKKHELSCKKI